MVVMKSSISIAGGQSHEYKTLPIVPVKLKEGAAARLLLHMPCSITAQHGPGAVRVCQEARRGGSTHSSVVVNHRKRLQSDIMTQSLSGGNGHG